MMDRFTMYPIAFVTTVQPWLAAWVLAISFFLTMMLVALLAREKSVKQIVLMTMVGYIAVTIVVALTTSFLLGIQMMDVEVVSVTPRTLP